MPQNAKCDRKTGHALSVRQMLSRAAVGAAYIALIGLGGGAAWAGDDDASDQSGMQKFLRTIGLRPSAVSSGDIKYTERPPLVVPPTRDLPAPEATGSVPKAADWPTEQANKHQKAPKPKVATVPTSQPANPNPEVAKKTWYNPMTWFNKEEYATFTGEPARENLTDPPTGYRTPSPDQPYGIGPEKKTDAKVTAADRGLTPAGH